MGFHDEFKKVKVLGEGSYGKVYKAENKETKEIVAAKELKMPEDTDGVHWTVLREVNLLSKLSECPQVVRLLKVFDDEKSDLDENISILLFEYMSSDLQKFIQTYRQRNVPIPQEAIKVLMYQLCKGVSALHSNAVLHRDLKPANVLLDSATLMLKIGDFGLSRSIAIPVEEYSREILTVYYKAPEFILGDTHYSMPLDMWSVGCIFAELATKEKLFNAVTEQGVLSQIFRLLGTPDENIWPGVGQLPNWHSSKRLHGNFTPRNLHQFFTNLDTDGVDLLRRLLHYEPATRISALDALEHPFFDNVDKGQYERT